MNEMDERVMMYLESHYPEILKDPQLVDLLLALIRHPRCVDILLEMDKNRCLADEGDHPSD
jgi:hypothetical protein